MFAQLWGIPAASISRTRTAVLDCAVLSVSWFLSSGLPPAPPMMSRGSRLRVAPFEMPCAAKLFSGSVSPVGALSETITERESWSPTARTQICWCASPCTSACACAAWATSRDAVCSCSARAAATTVSIARCAFILRVAATAWRTFAPRQSTAMRVAAPTRAFISTASAAFCRARLLLWYVLCAPNASPPFTRRARSVTVALSITVGSAANASCDANMGVGAEVRSCVEVEACKGALT
eukprot:scaffold32994_cov72-Phaeocystis_antarctica.AAC.3